MTIVQQVFLDSLKAALQGKSLILQTTGQPAKAVASQAAELTPAQWQELFLLAEKHHVLPMIYEAVHDIGAELGLLKQWTKVRQTVIRQITRQTICTAEFLSLYKHLCNHGIYPLIMKGLICRKLYPKPHCRFSADEDLLIPAKQFPTCHTAMLSHDMYTPMQKEARDAAYEVPYHKSDSPLYIELHKYPFAPGTKPFGDMNSYFEQVHGDYTTEVADGVELRTMAPTDHLFYLICHALKHFLHSGFGIRQVCDICLFADHYGASIDWERLSKNCRSIHADYFAASLLRIGEKYLVFDSAKACCPDDWLSPDIHEESLLADLLEAGVFGASSVSRKHSSNMTLAAASAQKKGTGTSGGVLKSLFPSLNYMKTKYPYVAKIPLLLPVAWLQRITDYVKESPHRSTAARASETLKIGAERIELLRQYKILP